MTTWSPQQDAALQAVSRWLKDPKGAQVFRLFGYAGTGKTTLAKEMAAGVEGDVLYACFTGKAALVLQKKGCAGASTIHSLIYKAKEDPATGITKFVLNPDSPAAHASLLIIDEVSMVGQDLAEDLLSYGKRILVLGDPAQLPPVKGEGYFIDAKPDVMLTEVHRQAVDNPIIRLSMDVREGRGLQVGAYGSSQVIQRRAIDKAHMGEMVVGADQLLCGLNKTRQAFNARLREIHGRKGTVAQHHPVVGERLVCLKNARSQGLLNGGLWEATQVNAEGNVVNIQARSLDDDALPHVDVRVREEFFTGTEKSVPWQELRYFEQFTFGYALTVHKSQGSQWDNVLLFDESFAFRDDYAKHLYTGITRAAEKVTVVV
jgi:ATP-dependent exoDNAse (exonuclease V) alpha subunit